MEIEINEWVDPNTGSTRRYLNGWHEACGIRIERYRTGNVAYAQWQGKEIPNRRGAMLAAIKVWLDEAGSLHIDHLSADLAHKPGITENTLRTCITEGLRAQGIKVTT